VPGYRNANNDRSNTNTNIGARGAILEMKSFAKPQGQDAEPFNPRLMFHQGWAFNLPDGALGSGGKHMARRGLRQ
jgi:hypothetical protein